jgi:DNA/RNA-binding domain of Phe-tRNA-synthetase-like protein
MRFIIDEKLFEQFPDLRVGAVMVEGADNSGNAEILKLLRESEREAEKKYACVQLSELPQIACWRTAYKAFGANDYRSSVEALLKRAIKGDALPDINPLVNLYNALSLKYLIPFGGEDLGAVQGDIVLDYARGDEPCVLIGETENRSPKVGEIIYKDSAGVLCRRWNWREAERTKLTGVTTRAILVCEDLFSGNDELCLSAINEYLETAVKFLGGAGKAFVLRAGEASGEV